MKKTITLLLSMAFALAGAQAQSSYTLRTLTFEDEDYAVYNPDSTNYWSSLIDSPQYGGKLLYGDYANVDYHWYDQGNTNLISAIPENWGGHVYWGGGHAISDYWNGNLNEGDYEHQLSVYVPGTNESGRGGHGHNGSKNFCVHYGYHDESGYSADNLPYIAFADGVARTIDNMYVNISTYLANGIYNGDSLTSTLGDDDYIYIEATGYNADGTETQKELFPLADGKEVVTNWTPWDLSKLGDVARVEFNMLGSNDNGYGFSQPAYFCYDDVAVRYASDTNNAQQRVIVSPNTEDSDENLKMLGVTVDVAYIAFTGDYDSSWTYQGDDLIQSQVKPGNTGKLVISGLPKNISIKKINATMNGGPLYTKGSIKVEAGEDEIAFLELGTRRTDVPTKITGKKTDYPLNMTTTSVNNDETDLTISLNCESGEYMYLYALEIYYTLNDVPTKIEKTTANIQEGKIYYNLQGQRVNNPSKGIYIVDGKKILIK
jgi:hypothetical protein